MLLKQIFLSFEGYLENEQTMKVLEPIIGLWIGFYENIGLTVYQGE